MCAVEIQNFKEHFEVSFKKTINTKVKKGIDTLADAVKSTLGPNGKNVVIKKFRDRVVTKDGVTVAKAILFEDDYENLGAEMIKESAIRTNDLAGDGTTTAVVLAQKLISEGLKKINRWFFKIKTIDLVKQIEEDSKIVIANLKRESKIISTKDEIINIATIAANEKEIGTLIGNIYNEIGKDGLIIAEDSGKAETSHEIIDGLRFERGMVSPYFVTDIKKEKAVIDDVYIIISDLDVLYFNNLIPLVDKIAENKGDNLVIIGNKITGEALMGMIQNKLQQRFKFLAIEAPILDRREWLEDLALITGGTFLDREMSFQFTNLELKDLGRAKKIICDKNSTIIVEGMGDKEKLKEKISFLRQDEEINRKRLEKFSSKVAVIKIGATTESELLEKKYRYEDAIEATKSALQEGIVVGGGIALINASKELPNNSIVKRACQEPFFQIMNNIDKNGRKYLKWVGGEGGYDARNEELVNLYEEGIIDALKVVRIALENAVSISTLFLKTEAIVLDIKDPKRYLQEDYKPLM